MTVPIQSQIYNPITGVFGNGSMRIFGVGQSGTFTVPAGVSAIRVRLWGAGGSSGGCGGGFALKTIYGLTAGTSIAVTVANGSGSTSSFGSYLSATGGAAGGGVAGSGTGGDINASGGLGFSGHGAGGAGNLFGNGGQGANSGTNPPFSGASGGGGGAFTSNSWSTPGAGSVIASGSGSYFAASTTNAGISINPATSGMTQFSIDFIGCGGGGAGSSTGGYGGHGVNGGGSGPSGSGGYPGGGGGAYGGLGLVIVEW